ARASPFQWLRQSNDSDHRKKRIDLAVATAAAVRLNGYAFYNYQRQQEGSRIDLDAERSVQATQLWNPQTVPRIDGGRSRSQPLRVTYAGEDVTDLIQRLDATEQYHTGVVNPGNRFQPGGGFTTGGRHALEEALCVQSTLYQSLAHATGHASPLGHFDVIVSPFVEFFRAAQDYSFLRETRTVTVFTMT
ncbi:unnamed protein product, partial [Amoebophrya sp. A25]